MTEPTTAAGHPEPLSADVNLRAWAEALRDRAGYIDVDVNGPIEWWEEVVSDVLTVATPSALDVLGDRVNRVIALHHIRSDGYCAECVYDDRDTGPDGEAWPCETVRLLTGDA